MNYSFQYSAERATTVKRVLMRQGVSHRLLIKLFAADLVFLNGEPTQNQPVIHGDKVRFELPPSTGVAQSQAALQIVEELDNWLIVNKPVGLASVPGPHDQTDSLLNRAAGYLAGEGIEGPQPAVITRLDRDTCGLVLIAKHIFAQGKLDQAGETGLTKQYQAVVAGRVTPAVGTITLPLGKAADGIHREVQEGGQAAITDYAVAATQGAFSLVNIVLKTGRTHQIRAHFAAIGHPLIGDPLYGEPTPQYQHQLLQASGLTFTDPFTGLSHFYHLAAPTEWPSFPA
ncbi:RluA family pseudouridine synthase [Lacticaseibacillus jixianensis]|uniref:RNA pseudouridylate synthase n=1 Tax=Lacticaseibacillus jixianensis TaxID=2486012 RepID=A0ABW4B8J0_9LACO|nr:RluA family pseudouridine synthase [Lacticaseibacillus jixianensis]